MAGLTTFTVARFPPQRAPQLLASVFLERFRLGRQSGLAWGRYLGTSRGGHTLGVDLARWAWFCCWDDEAAAGHFHDDLQARLDPTEIATLWLRPLRSRGRWAGHSIPVADPAEHADPMAGNGTPGSAAEPVVVVTRARVRPTRWRPFTGAMPGVDADLGQAPGLLHSIGVGEWPVLTQGTLSVWADTPSMTAFARTQAHRTAVRRTADEGWYAEELFARFSVERVAGMWDGAVPLASGRPHS